MIHFRYVKKKSDYN